MAQAIDLTGQRFGRLVVLRRGADYTGAGKPQRRWICQCECGMEILTYRGGLRSGRVKSCGCLQRDVVAMNSTTHGRSTSPEYVVWSGMHARCRDASHESFQRYGARGIQVCERWNSFEAFYTDMGPRPDGMTLERNDNDGNYEPGNCRWATRIEQARNTRKTVFITFEGETLSLADWGRRLNTKTSTLRQRWAKFATLRPIGRYQSRGPYMTRKFAEPQGFEEGEAPQIQMNAVESSQLKAIGYDAATKTLACQFTRGPGHIYHYPNVEPETHAAFVAGDLGPDVEPSIGTFFGKHIKPLPFKKYRAPAGDGLTKQPEAA